MNLEGRDVPLGVVGVITPPNVYETTKCWCIEKFDQISSCNSDIVLVMVGHIEFSYFGTESNLLQNHRGFFLEKYFLKSKSN